MKSRTSHVTNDDTLSVLVVHNKYQQLGGEDVTVDAEVSLLRSVGVRVETLIYDSGDDQRIRHLKQRPDHLIYNREVYDHARRLIRKHKLQLVHCHNLVPLLSTSIYAAALAERVPIVQTVHNYRMGCLNGLHLRGGKLCERCSPGKHVPGMVFGCYRHSRVQSIALGIAQTANAWRGAWQQPTLYITPTQFLRQKLVSWGIASDNIIVKPHFVQHDPGPRLVQGEYAVFVGRLSPEKGVDLLLSVWNNQRIPLVIVGDGPLRRQLEQHVKDAGLRNVHFVGYQHRAGVDTMLRRARFLIMPSQWLEIFGLVQIEAYAHGIPVLASRLGAMADVVQEGVTGLLFEAGNRVDLADKISMMEGNTAQTEAMGRAARHLYETMYSAQASAAQLQTIYKEAVARCRRVRVDPSTQRDEYPSTT